MAKKAKAKKVVKAKKAKKLPPPTSINRNRVEAVRPDANDPIAVTIRTVTGHTIISTMTETQFVRCLLVHLLPEVEE